MDAGFHSTAARRRAVNDGICVLLSHKERAATPIPFRDLLLDMAQERQVKSPGPTSGGARPHILMWRDETTEHFPARGAAAFIGDTCSLRATPMLYYALHIKREWQ